MIRFFRGDILQADAEAIVNPVNCVGVMGRGLALQVKRMWPENFTAYAQACKTGKVVPGRMFVFYTGWLMNPKYIINFPTKRHWSMASRIEDIEAGLDALVEEVKRLGICSVAIPALGTGLGGLDWSLVKNKIEEAAQELANVEVWVYEPIEASGVV